MELHVDFFVKISMDEGIVNNKLSQMPTFNWCKSQEGVDDSDFGNKGECIQVAYTILLFVSFGC